VAMTPATPDHRAAPAAWWRLTRWQYRQLMGVAYAAPTVVFVAVFFITPLLLVARMSLSSWPLLTGNNGLNFPRNYLSIWNNALFGPAVVFTIEYTLIVTVLLIGLGLGLALLVQERGRWVDMLRTVILLPVSVGLAAASLLFWGFYSPSIGPINPILEQLGLIHDPISFLGTSLSALLSTSFLIVWKYSGLYMLIFLVGLQAIPDDLFEAAALNGASRIQVFRHITLPLLRPSIALALILCVTGSLLALFNYGAGLVQFLLNSAYVAFLTVAITLAVSTFGGYAFARFRFPGREALFLLTLSILMVPYATLLIPLYVLLNGLGLQNSLIGLSLVLAMFQLPFATYMMRISFEAVPREAGGIRTGGRLRHVQRPVANPPSLGVARAHHSGPVRLPGGMERLLSSPHPANRQRKTDPAARGCQPAAADDGRHRLRCHGSRRRGDGRPLPDPVPAAATSLRAWFHVRSRQGLTRRLGCGMRVAIDFGDRV
jgi:multiple sugar transport system permease protein